MRIRIKQLVSRMAVLTVALACTLSTTAAWASEGDFGFTVSPMNQSIVLSPGDVYRGSFKVLNPNSNTEDLFYAVDKKSFYVDENYNTTYDEEDSPIVSWTTIDSNTSGVLHPNESVDVVFTIKVPETAAAGGQYEAFRVISQAVGAGEGDSSNGGVTAIKEQLMIVHLLFAEITGETFRQGEVTNINVPGFLLNGDVYGESSIKNTGNIHSLATYSLQVFPLFSDEELYSNEEDSDVRNILPDRTRYNRTYWANTPTFGIFRVVYTVEFEGVTAQVNKIVIKCPIWMLAIIIFAIAAIIIYFVARAKARKTPRRAETE